MTRHQQNKRNCLDLSCSLNVHAKVASQICDSRYPLLTQQAKLAQKNTKTICKAFKDPWAFLEQLMAGSPPQNSLKLHVLLQFDLIPHPSFQSSDIVDPPHKLCHHLRRGSEPPTPQPPGGPSLCRCRTTGGAVGDTEARTPSKTPSSKEHEVSGKSTELFVWGSGLRYLQITCPVATLSA